MDQERLLERIERGSVTNVRFSDAKRLLEALGFELRRTVGSHHIFTHPDVRELINLQDVGGQVKPYQLRQLRRIIQRYALGLEER